MLDLVLSALKVDLKDQGNSVCCSATMLITADICLAAMGDTDMGSFLDIIKLVTISFN